MAESSSSSGGVFGDDINATPLSKLTMAPKMTSKSDSAAVTPPVYDPSIPQDPKPKKKVRFDDDYIEYTQKKKKKSAPAYYYPPPAAPLAPLETTAPPKKRIVRLLSTYSHLLLVCALVALVLWYYPKLATIPYAGSYGALNTFGIALVSCAAAGVYGVAEHVID